MFKCFQNRSKQTVIKSAESLKLENTLVSLKTQIPAIQRSKRNVTEIASNEIPSILEHSQLIKSAISMNAKVKCSIIEASTKLLNKACQKLRGIADVPPQRILETATRQLRQLIFFWSAPVAFRRVALETPEWSSRDSNHHRQSVSAGKTNAIPTEPSGRLRQLRQLSCILDSCTISASYEVSQAQKALLLIPYSQKGASTSSEELNAKVSLPTDEYHTFQDQDQLASA